MDHCIGPWMRKYVDTFICSDVSLRFDMKEVEVGAYGEGVSAHECPDGVMVYPATLGRRGGYPIAPLVPFAF